MNIQQLRGACDHRFHRFQIIIIQAIDRAADRARSGAVTNASRVVVPTTVKRGSFRLGITRIMEDSGLMHKLSNFFTPAISRLFKNVPKGHSAITSITLNLLANFLGIGNAATPLGIKAMEDLQTLNPHKDTVSFEMMLFVVINTASVQFIPFTVIGLLASYGSHNPNKIFLPTFLTTTIHATSAVIILYIFKRFYDKGK